MNIFDVNYTPQKGLKRNFRLGFSAYAGILSLLFCANNYLKGVCDVWFYCFALLFFLSLAAVLSLTLCRSKPIASISTESLWFNIGRKMIYSWDNITGIGIGIASLTIENVGAKPVLINLETIRYNEIKMLKSRIIEICEAKKIPYRNDY
ncbi:MAG: hypothetical protein LBR34_04325 [Prevotella sp.]|jgi:hypothetical protein|nr:hypothetical protein [Prevotella sp.]